MSGDDLYQRALSHWGRVPQLLMLAEECSECSVAVLHYLRGRGSDEQLAEEVADAIVYLGGAAAVSITGHVLVIDGGLTAA